MPAYTDQFYPYLSVHTGTSHTARGEACQDAVSR